MLYNDKLKQDFLKPELVFQLQNAGVDMKDAYYHIYKSDGTYYLSTHNWLEGLTKEEEKQYEYVCPTYSLSELLYKLIEYLGKEITLTNLYEILTNLNELCCHSEYPIEVAAHLLLKYIK